jgi:hypothetical protein
MVLFHSQHDLILDYVATQEWIFDDPGSSPRLLRFRSGHYRPPTSVLHYGTNGRSILSAGQDRAFRVFSTIQDQQSKELSQGHVKKKVRTELVDNNDNKTFWPTWAVGAFFRGVRCIHVNHVRFHQPLSLRSQDIFVKGGKQP